jgi:hypothetical protein
MPDPASDKLIFWLLTSAFSIVLMLFGVWTSAIAKQHDNLAAEVNALKQPLYSTVESVKNINEWLTRVEGKLDRVIQTK